MIRLLAVLAALSAQPARADVVFLDNGDQMTGRVVGLADGKLKFALEIGAEIDIPWGKVFALETDAPVNLVLGKGTHLNGRISTASDGAMVLALDSGALARQVEFRPVSVSAINPAQPDAPTAEKKAEENKWKQSGNVNVGLALTNGNSKTHSYHIDGKIKLRDAKNRVTISGSGDQSKDRDVTTEATARGSLVYDRFLTEKWFVNSNLTLDHDDLQDLRLRTSTGLGLGYQFYESDPLNLSATLGFNYVTENYRGQDSQDDVSARWTMDYDQKVWKEKLQLFHSNEALVALDDTEDYIINTRTGVRVPLSEHLKSTAQVNLDYENMAPAGNSKTDTKYMLNLGYDW